MRLLEANKIAGMRYSGEGQRRKLAGSNMRKWDSQLPERAPIGAKRLQQHLG